MLDYLRYKEATASTLATKESVDELSRVVNQSIWAKFKQKYP
jgi:hypothetical protein